MSCLPRAGYGSQALSLKYLGVNFEHWRICEWATKSIQAYKDVHFTNDNTNYSKDLTQEQVIDFLFKKGVSMNYNEPMSYDQIKRKGEEWQRVTYNNIIATHNLVNISQVKGKDLEITDTDKYDYILTYSFPCGLAGQQVKTNNGYKNIEDITTNDFVLTHTNSFKKVVKTMSRSKQGYYKIKYVGGELELTEEHPMYVYRNDKFEWVKVKDLLLTDKLTININTKSIDTVYDNKMLWLLGRYVADGHYNKFTYNSINFSISFEKEKEFLDNIPENFVNKFKKFKKKCWDYRIADKDFKDLCLQFNTGAKNKEIPQWIIDLPKEKLQSFFDGYMSGDGFSRNREKSEEKMFSTVSKKLFFSLQDIIVKLYGRVCSLYIRKDNRKETFSNSYCGQFSITKENKFYFTKEDKICLKINSIKYIDELVQVYNFEVEEDNSYTLNNIIVHNCQDLSLAGKRAGMEKDSGTRSGLLWEVERILDECNVLGQMPKILLMENVPEVVGTGNIEHFKKWREKLEQLGYFNYDKILNAKDYGIPQNRRRCFMISILGEYNYSFPTPIPLKIRLKDLLEKNVDEKFYLSSEKLERIQSWGGYEDPLKDTSRDRVCSTITTHVGKDSNGMQLVEDSWIENKYKKFIDKNGYIPNEFQPFNEYELEDGIAPTQTTSCGSMTGKSSILIKEATKKGYKEAYEGDGIDIGGRMESHRGTVQRGVAQTLKTSGDEVGVVVVGNYSPSNHNAARVVDQEGLAPTVMENHGTVTAIVEEENLKTKLCNDLIASGKVKENDVIRHNYSTRRNKELENKNVETNNISPTLDTRCDCLGVVVKDSSMFSETEKQLFTEDGNIKRYINSEVVDKFEEGQMATTTFPNGYGHGPRTHNESIALNTIDKPVVKQQLRIRKLSPTEALRLMGVKDEDITNMSKNQSDASLWHVAGDSIVTTPLMAMFSQFFDIDWRDKLWWH